MTRLRTLHRWPDKPIIAHEANRRGRDLVIGDLHGHFDTLGHALEQLAFDPARDRLFSVGDLIDRGPRSADALEWLEQGRIASVRGNHEQMMIDTLTTAGGRLTKSGPARMWADNGGRWWWGLNEEDATKRTTRRRKHHGRLDAWVRALRDVPYLRTVETARGRLGIVHTTARYHSDWAQIVEMLRTFAARDNEMRERFEIHGGDPPNSILWARPEIERIRRDAEDLPEALGNIALVLIGHTPGRTPRWSCPNVLCIDTGVHIEEYGHLTVAEVQTGEARLHRVRRDQGDEIRGPLKPALEFHKLLPGIVDNVDMFVYVSAVHQRHQSLKYGNQGNCSWLPKASTPSEFVPWRHEKEGEGTNDGPTVTTCGALMPS